MGARGAGHQVLNSNKGVADDFTVPSGETWNISTASFYAYQTGSTTTSTMTSVNVRIWDGPPGVAGSQCYFWRYNNECNGRNCIYKMPIDIVKLQLVQQDQL